MRITEGSGNQTRDGLARLAETDNVYLEGKPSDSSREISKGLYYECRVSFCERN